MSLFPFCFSDWRKGLWVGSPILAIRKNINLMEFGIPWLSSIHCYWLTKKQALNFRSKVIVNQQTTFLTPLINNHPGGEFLLFTKSFRRKYWGKICKIHLSTNIHDTLQKIWNEIRNMASIPLIFWTWNLEVLFQKHQVQ